jgi:hypothetical protein
MGLGFYGSLVFNTVNNFTMAVNISIKRNKSVQKISTFSSVCVRSERVLSPTEQSLDESEVMKIQYLVFR